MAMVKNDTLHWAMAVCNVHDHNMNHAAKMDDCTSICQRAVKIVREYYEKQREESIREQARRILDKYEALLPSYDPERVS